MRRTALLLLIAACISGCKTRQLEPLSSHYPAHPVMEQKTTDLSTGTVWQRLMKLVDDHRLTIRESDSAGGYFQSGLISFTNAYQIDGDSSPRTKPVYVSVQKEYLSHRYGHIADPDDIVQPSFINGLLTVSIFSDSGTTYTQVSIEDLKNYHAGDSAERAVVSTQVLESNVADYVAGYNDSISLNIQNGEVLNPKSNYLSDEERSRKIGRNILMGLGIPVVSAGVIVLAIYGVNLSGLN